MKYRFRLWLAVFVAAGFLSSCGPSSTPKVGETRSIQLITRPDGLAYALDSSIPYTGEVTIFTAALTRQSVATYQNGLLHGPSRRYWSNGSLKREDRSEAGNLIHQTQWYEDGTMKHDTEMQKGVSFGKIRLWWPDGRLRRSALVGPSLGLHGHLLEYAEDGSILADAIFHHGQYISGKLPPESVANFITAQAH